jgi:hypothetical protein
VADDDAYLKLLQEKGFEHERALNDQYLKEGRRLVEISGEGSLEERTACTREAMRSGADMIYQGAFFSGRWHGYAEHQECTLRSEEEGTRVAALYQSLLGQRWIEEAGNERPLTVDDILVVSPYSMQVNLLQRLLPTGARVGTVDKSQGQEAAAVIVSMTASSAGYGVSLSNVLARAAFCPAHTPPAAETYSTYSA